jgi:hypothetical protein
MKVGLCGYARVGKDTAAEHMVEYERFAFADALKNEASNMMAAIEIDPDWTDPVFKARWRPLLVALGAGRRATDPDYWIKRLIYTLAARGVAKQDNVVITDVRYANEVQWILGQGGTVIRIERPEFGPANDEEARSFLEIDSMYPKMPTVVNDGTPADLVQKVLIEIQKTRR